LTASIPSRLTRISPLLLAAQRGESHALQPHHLGLEQAQIDERAAGVVLALDLVHRRPGDLEDRHTPPVAPAYEGPHQLAAAQEPQGAQEEVVRVKHPRLLPGDSPPGALTTDLKRREVVV
jgi:hypothetical protein